MLTEDFASPYSCIEIDKNLSFLFILSTQCMIANTSFNVNKLNEASFFPAGLHKLIHSRESSALV